ncbi:hypothetical protein MKY84_13610 [Chryseomicrobium sp. FSL W7-1435]|uniref:hypothetical protein n=1 Tax=Chryseomicrobium sp. FSL W7-1435 TaxID=2921704 RepID=UPI00315B0DBB
MDVKIVRAIVGIPIILVGAMLLGVKVNNEPISTLIVALIGSGLIFAGIYIGFYNRETFGEREPTSKSQKKLIHSANRALHSAVPKATKAIYAKVIGDTLIWRVYFDAEPTEDEMERLNEAQTEIIADFPKVQSVNENYIVHPAPINYSTSHYSEWIYSRVEGE